MIKPGFFKRFSDLTKDDLSVDLHIHTKWTDGNSTAGEIIDKAIEMGIHAIAFTEHVRKESEYYPRFFQSIDSAREKNSIRILIGAETKVLNDEGELDIRVEDLSLAELLLASVHRMPLEGKFVSPVELPKEKLFELERKYALAIIKGAQAHVLAHPGGMSIITYGEFPQRYWKELVFTIAQTDMALEINYRYLQKVDMALFMSVIRRYNPYVSIGSDVHNLSELGSCSRLLRDII